MTGDTNLDVTIPTRAMNRTVAKMRKMNEDGMISIEDITMKIMHPNERHKLLGENNLNFLQDIIVSRDNVKNGMCRAEVITLIGDLVQCSNKTACKNHWDHLVRKGKINQLKSEGKEGSKYQYHTRAN